MESWASIPEDVLAKCVGFIESRREEEFSKGSGIWTAALKAMSSICRSWRRVLHHIRLLRPRCPGDQLPRILFHFPNLQILDLHRCHPSSHVSWEDLCSGQVEAVPFDELHCLMALPKLTSLEVRHIGDQELMMICRLTQLESLTLGEYSRMTSDGVMQLTGLQSLTALMVLGDGGLDSGSYTFLSELQKLQSLSLHNCHVDDASLDVLTGLTALRRLSLFSCCRILGEGLTSLRDLLRLTELNVGATGINDEALFHLIRCPRLIILNLNFCHFPLAHDRLSMLRVLPLKELFLIRCEGICFETVLELKQNLKECCVHFQKAGDSLKDPSMVL